MGMHSRAMKIAGEWLPRGSRSLIDQRIEERHDGVCDRAVILFREQEYLVTVVNISSRGTMIESDLVPRIGENMAIQFDRCTRIQGFVRWIRDGRIGLNFGHEIILG